MRDREWHVNKHELRRLCVLRLKQRNTIGDIYHDIRSCAMMYFAGIEERNVAFRVSFDAVDTSYAEFSFFQHVEWSCMPRTTDMTISNITEPRFSAHP